MIYSVWHQPQGVFRYFDDGVPQAHLNVEKPTHLRERALGSTIDQAAWPLPAGAREIGSGAVPVGRVASMSGQALGDDVDTASTTKAVMLAIAGIVAWKVLSRKKRTP